LFSGNEKGVQPWINLQVSILKYLFNVRYNFFTTITTMLVWGQSEYYENGSLGVNFLYIHSFLFLLN